MKILHVVESLDRGGLERVVADLCMEQQRRGDTPGIFCLFHRGAIGDELEQSGLTPVEGFKRPGLDLNVLRTLRALATEEAVDVVHSHNPVAGYYVAMARLLASTGGPHVNTRHNMGARNKGDRREKLFRLSTRVIDRVVMVSQEVANKFVTERWVPGDKVRVQINGIPFGRYMPRSAENRAYARQALGIPPDAFLIGTVGRFVTVKNQKILLESLRVLRARIRGVRLVFIGEGPLRPELEGMARDLGIRDLTTFAGERNNVAQLLPGFDVFALPSLSEGHSIALLEAAASALPAVVTAVGGNPEIVQDGVTGTLVPVNDAAAIADAIHALAQEPEKAAAMGVAARGWVKTTASIEAMATGYDAIYRDAAR